MPDHDSCRLPGTKVSQEGALWEQLTSKRLLIVLDNWEHLIESSARLVAAAAWHSWTPTLQAWLSPVTKAMLDMARLQPGDRVLDLAAGAGEPSLSAAERVGPSGHVLATDISSNILLVRCPDRA